MRGHNTGFWQVGRDSSRSHGDTRRVSVKSGEIPLDSLWRRTASTDQPSSPVSPGQSDGQYALGRLDDRDRNFYLLGPIIHATNSSRGVKEPNGSAGTLYRSIFATATEAADRGALRESMTLRRVEYSRSSWNMVSEDSFPPTHCLRDVFFCDLNKSVSQCQQTILRPVGAGY